MAEYSEEFDRLRRIAGRLGPEEILCQCAEECSELAQAVLKMRRAIVGTTPLTQGEARALINEEVADVLNCVEALEAISFVDRGQVARIQKEKLERWDRRTMEGVSCAGCWTSCTGSTRSSWR